MKSYDVLFSEKPGYLHVTVTGQNSKASVMGYMEEVVQECARRGLRNVLIEEHLVGPRVNMMEVFQIVAEGSIRMVGVFSAIAYVDANAEGSLMSFAETVATNRFMPVKIFSKVEDAEQWLLNKLR